MAAKNYKPGATKAALDPEEGRLSEVLNRTAGMRAWNLRRSRVRSQVNW